VTETRSLASVHLENLDEWTEDASILRHAKPHVTKERYIKAFDPAVLATMGKLETSLDATSQSAPN
jgi:hypothetical protein